MKRRVLTVFLALTLAATFSACGGSKEGAETQAVADESISDLSTPSAGYVPDSSSTAGKQTTAAATSGNAQGTSGTSDIITPIPAEEITGDGTVANAAAGTTAEGTAATDTAGTAAAGTAAGTAAAGTANGTAAAESTDSTAAPTESAPQKMTVTAEINVREEADLDGDILGGYDEGDEVTVIGAEGEWFIVDYYGETGYINSKYVKPSETASSSSAASDSGNAENSEDSEYSKYGNLVDGDGDPVNLQYYDGSYEIYDEDGNQVFIEGVND